MNFTERWLQKEKYHAKTLSENAIYNIYIRMLDVLPLFAEYLWLHIPLIDLTELGMSLLYDIVPIEFEPFALNFTYTMPTPNEILQGIWIKFEWIDYAKIYNWMIDMEEYLKEMYKEEYMPKMLHKGIYDVTPYHWCVYDPILYREFLRSTFLRFRLLRIPDISWEEMMDGIADYMEMVGVTGKHIFNRLMMIFSAQTNAFVLGMGVLGRSKLTETVEGWGTVPIKTADGGVYNLRFKTLDHMQMGLIPGVTPLGYGLLLPEETIYRLPEGKKNPECIQFMVDKIRDILNRHTTTTWAYSNYNKVEEMHDYHKSERTAQYHLLQTQRAIVEDWVARRIPPEEANPVRIRQYQNAVLQAIAWRAKRHRWGYDAWKYMTEDQFKGWWKQYWVGQGLNESTLENLYQGMSVWLRRLREEKVRLGERVKEIRRRMALLT